MIYDIIIEPPAIGSTVDEHGHSRPVAFMPYRVNGQYIMEGLASSMFFTLGAIGFIILDKTHQPSSRKLSRIFLISIGFSLILVSFLATWIFMRMKLPRYVFILFIFSLFSEDIFNNFLAGYHYQLDFLT
ncbi:hypothetical protein SSS_06935 [Sarcoptes scabiei]|nr:hypothetical protein SSS_06935 [Sarcoptes scabiei]